MQHQFNLKDQVYFYNKYSNEILFGEIVDIRHPKHNWDYKIRYLIRPDTDVWYEIWIESKYVSVDEQTLFKYLV